MKDARFLNLEHNAFELIKKPLINTLSIRKQPPATIVTLLRQHQELIQAFPTTTQQDPAAKTCKANPKEETSIPQLSQYPIPYSGLVEKMFSNASRTSNSSITAPKLIDRQQPAHQSIQALATETYP